MSIIDRVAGNGATNVDVTTTGYVAAGLGGASHYVAAGVRVTGSMNVSGTTPARIRGGDTGSPVGFAVASPVTLGSADCRGEFLAYFPDGASSYQIGIGLRGNTSTLSGYSTILNGGNFTQYRGPNFTANNGTPYADSIAPGVYRHVSLECVGNTQKTWIDGVLRISDGTDATFPSDGNLWLTIQTSLSTDLLGPQFEWVSGVTAGGSRVMAAPTLTQASGNVTAVWSPSTGGTGPAKFQLQRAPDVSGSAGTYVSQGSATWTLTQVDSGLSAGTYWYRLAVTDASATTTFGTGASITIGSVTPSFVLIPTTAVVSTGVAMSATGTGTSWVNGVTTISVTGGTGASISSLVINNGTQVASFTLNPGSAAGTLTIHDSLDSATGTVTVSSGSATTYSASPSASSTTVGTPITLTFQANAIPSVALVITPATNGSGVFSPLTVTASDAATHTCTYTPSSVGSGTHVLSFTHTGGGFSGSDPTALNITVTSGGGSIVIPVTDTNLYFSLYNWFSDGGGSLQASNVKASSTFVRSDGSCPYFCAAVTGTANITVNVDNSQLDAISGIVSAGYPQLSYMLNKGPITTVILTTGTTVAFVLTGLSGTNQLKVWVKSVNHNYNTYTAQANAVKITGITVDTGGATVPLTGYFAPYSNNMVVFGDSTMVAYLVDGLNDDRNSDCLAGSAFGIAQKYSCNAGIIATPGQGINAPGNMGFPAAYNSLDTNNQAYQFHYAAHSRLVGGVLSPVPKIARIKHGANDTNNSAFQTSYQAFIGVVRTICGPLCTIVCEIPYGQFCASGITAAVAAYNTANPSDTLVKLGDCGVPFAVGLDNTSGGTGTFRAVDGVHMKRTAYMEAAPLETGFLDTALGLSSGAGSYPTVSQIASAILLDPTKPLKTVTGGYVQSDLSQPITDTRAATFGGALAGAWASAWGMIVIDKTNRLLKMFGIGQTPASTPPSATFDVDDGTSPSERINTR